MRRPTRRITLFALTFSLLLSIGLLAAAPGISNIASATNLLVQDDDNSFDEQFNQGVENLRRHRFEEALKNFKRANDLREKKSAQAYLGMAQAYVGLEAHKNVIESADRIIELSGGDAKMIAQAYNLKGLAQQAQAEGKNTKKLQEAEASLRQGLTAGPEIVPMIHFNLGVVLMQQNRDAEGAAELQKYVALEPKTSYAESAKKLIENPRRAREPFAPDFSFTTADGEFITLEDLRGKVVVLDFWGTWCGPCVDSVPSLRNLNKRYSKDPAFVLIGIATRDEEEVWRQFTAENKMVWRQYRDKDGQVQRAFAVRAFPTYMVIDHEGVLRYRAAGAGPQRESALDDAVKKQLKLVAKSATAN
jgi:thiol-disulfide isomerase/thioredoxin